MEPSSERIFFMMSDYDEINLLRVKTDVFLIIIYNCKVWIKWTADGGPI